MELNIRKIKTEGLIQLMIGPLCTFYSYGGISCGRSISSRLLEAASLIIRHNDYKSLCVPWKDKYPPDEELIAEAKKRKGENDRLIKVSFDKNIYQMKNSAILFLGLKDYSNWIKQLWDDDRKESGKNKEYRCIGRWELDMASALPALFCPLNKPPEISREEILREENRRFTTIVKLRHEARFRNEGF
ncbi:MAG: hypothetical protein PHP03_03300 [Candidatus Pacebacteria bacterium]|nr:hypothetical protein [Candidatus Paceibacterota bacterium]